jgi:hypothetical protein
MLLRYSVSFESDLQPVRTARGEIDVANVRLGARRALEAAQKQCPRAGWRSVVVVLEKTEAETAEAGGDRSEESERVGRVSLDNKGPVAAGPSTTRR